jgi:hypothetical protein
VLSRPARFRTIGCNWLRDIGNGWLCNVRCGWLRDIGSAWLRNVWGGWLYDIGSDWLSKIGCDWLRSIGCSWLLLLFGVVWRALKCGCRHSITLGSFTGMTVLCFERNSRKYEIGLLSKCRRGLRRL